MFPLLPNSPKKYFLTFCHFQLIFEIYFGHIWTVCTFVKKKSSTFKRFNFQEIIRFCRKKMSTFGQVGSKRSPALKYKMLTYALTIKTESNLRLSLNSFILILFQLFFFFFLCVIYQFFLIQYKN